MDSSIDKILALDFPPGTVRLQDDKHSTTILVPQPSSDPNEPLNWSTRRKVLHMTILCVYTTLIFAILTVTPPLWQNITDELGISTDDLNYGYATAYASLTIAALIFIPLSVMFGRRPVYLSTSLISLASAVWMANIRTTVDVIGSSLLSGIAGSVNEALFNVTICDLFFIHQRGTMTGIYLFVVILGTYLAPIASGYIALSQGWRWVFWHCSILSGVIGVVMVFLLEETKWEATSPEVEPADIITPQKGSTEQVECTSKHSVHGSLVQPCSTNGTALKSYRERHPWYTPSKNTISSTSSRALRHLCHPFLILVTFPAVMFSALQYAWSESMLSFLAVTQASLYPLPPYSFSAIGVGDMNIAPAIGAILGSIFGGVLSDHLILKIARRRRGIYEPEYRLWTFMVPGSCMVAGVLLYGLTIAKGMPWIINAIGAGLVGFALGGCGDIALVYVQDAYDGIIAPALIAIVFIRNGMATIMTFVIPAWQTNMGVYNMFVLLGALTALVVLTCVPLIIWGRRWRQQRAHRYIALSEHA